jgi:hypothetical protein
MGHAEHEPLPEEGRGIVDGALRAVCGVVPTWVSHVELAPEGGRRSAVGERS